MSDRIVVVDEEDNVVGAELRSIVDEKGLRYRVSGLWLRNSRGEVLLARRALTKTHYPGRWGPAVAGTVEEGESYEQNIVKEAEEELGLILGRGLRQRGMGSIIILRSGLLGWLMSLSIFLRFKRKRLRRLGGFLLMS